MKNSILALAAGAGIILAPISTALANTVAAQSEGTIASAWVPATLVEQQAARGGGNSYSGLSPLFGGLNTVCNNFRFSFNVQVGSYYYSRYCGKRIEPS